MTDGPVYTGLDWADYQVVILAYCGLDAAVVDQITCATVIVGNTVTIGGVTFTAAAAEDQTAREFDQSGTDAECAVSLVSCVNNADYGVSGITSSSALAVVSLTRAVDGVRNIITAVGGTMTIAYDANLNAYDNVLEIMFDAAKRKVDEYLNNPFEELNPTIVFSGVEENDYVTVNGQTYTVKETADEDELYFALGASDSLTADNFCTYVNSTTLGGSYGAVGVAGVLATNSSGTVTLTRRYGNVDDIKMASSDEDKLLVRQVRTSIDIPEVVAQWICQFIRRHFKNREALMQENITGKSVKMWLSMKSEESGMTDNFDLISQYRIPVGL